MEPNEVVEVIEELEDEVNNGGFHQYFNNSSGDNAAAAVNALETIRAFRMAHILKRAIAKFPENVVPEDRGARLEILWNSFPNTNEFDDLDSEFLAYPDDISAMIAKYRAQA